MPPKSLNKIKEVDILLNNMLWKKYIETRNKVSVQNGGVEVCVLISSCESTKLATNCWTTVDRRTLERTKKRYPVSKDEEATARQWEQHINETNPTPTGWMTHGLGNSNTKEAFPLLWRFWTPRQAAQPGDLTKGLGIPKKSGLEGQGDLIIGLLLDWERDSSLEKHKQNPTCTKTQRKGAVIPQETEPKLPAHAEGSPVEAWVGRTSPQGHWQEQARKVPLGINSLAPRAGSPQAKQLSGRECNPTHQQIIWLKLYWARSCPPEQDPVFPTISPSHQKAYISLLASSTRG